MSSPPSVQPSSGGQSQKAARENRKLGTFFSDKTLSDVIVKFGNQEIFAHRLILVKSSVWFETALLGEFKVMIDIGDDDDPAAVTAMLKFFYDGTYRLDGLDGNPADQHLTIDSSPNWNNPDLSSVIDHVVRAMQKILGPSADTFADNSIQQDAFKFICREASYFYKNELFQELLSNGSMFSKAFGCRFAQKTGELITRLKSRSHGSFGTDSPIAEPWNIPWSWDTPAHELNWEVW
ncbi:hypothetical protein KCU78_g10765, partial [Aureobasidium melanogenum]